MGNENKKAVQKDSKNENDEDVFQAIEEINAGIFLIFPHMCATISPTLFDVETMMLNK